MNGESRISYLMFPGPELEDLARSAIDDVEAHIAALYGLRVNQWLGMVTGWLALAASIVGTFGASIWAATSDQSGKHAISQDQIVVGICLLVVLLCSFAAAIAEIRMLRTGLNHEVRLAAALRKRLM